MFAFTRLIGATKKISRETWYVSPPEDDVHETNYLLLIRLLV